ncbi:hypothetical protein B5S31_g2398 [[Candida] boidinii]|nr:hypothetical protein B5S31_g2398 [[Candida] boidinii]
MKLLYNNIKEVVALGSLIPIAASQPYVGFPFNQQLPDVARVGEAFNFAISSQTYKSSIQESISYSVDDLPSWLSFDSSSLTFTGTPQSSDATNNLQINLSGSDSEGSISNSYSIVVSADAGPQLSTTDTLFHQLQEIGDTNGYDGLILSPNEAFEITFNKDTFNMPSGSSHSIVDYYGRFNNRTSLPNWISFNSDTLSFSGTAPTVNSDIAPSINYGFMLIATDYQGYTAAYSTFSLVIGAHTLYTSLNSTIVVNATAGDSFEASIPLSDVFYDGESIQSDEISSVNLYEAPSWVSVSDDNTNIKGTVPEDQLGNEVLNLTITDKIGNSVFINYEIDVLNEILEVNSLPNVNATKGEFFIYSLNPSDFSDLENTTIKATFDDDSNWLKYYYTNYTFAGTVPDDFDSLTVDLDCSMNSLTKSVSFKIFGVDGTLVSSSSSSSSASSSGSHSSSSSSSSSSTFSSSSASSSSAVAPTSSGSAVPTTNKKSSDNNKKLAIGLGVAIPLAAILLAVILLFFCCWRPRQQKKKQDKENEVEKGNGPSGSGKTGGAGGAGVAGEAGYYSESLSPVDSLNTFDSADTAKRLSALNVLKLDDEKYDEGDISSNITAGSNSKSIYHDALNHQSSDNLIPIPIAHGKNGSNGDTDLNTKSSDKVKRSWRDYNGRDSVASLATVATTDLLTVKVADNPNLQRRSQLSSFGLFSKSNSLLKRSTSSHSSNFEVLGNNGSNENNGLNNKNNGLHTLNEESDSMTTSPNFRNPPAESNKSSPEGYVIPNSKTADSLSSFRPQVNKNNGEFVWSYEARNQNGNNETRPTNVEYEHNDDTVIPPRRHPYMESVGNDNSSYGNSNSNSGSTNSGLNSQGLGKKKSSVKLVDFTRKSSADITDKQDEHSFEGIIESDSDKGSSDYYI